MKKIYFKILGLVIIGLIIASLFTYLTFIKTPVVQGQDIYEVKNFGSYSELTTFLQSGYQNYEYRDSFNSPSIQMNDEIDWDVEEAGKGGIKDYSYDETSSYSDTNVQVSGVDEPDIVKTDGTYIYLISNNNLIILKAHPAENATIITEISIEPERILRNILISETKLILFIESYQYPILKNYIGVDYGSDVDEDSDMEVESSDVSPWYNSPDTYVKIYDIQNIESPSLIREIVMQGAYTEARMIDDYVYVITTQYSYSGFYNEGREIVPTFMVDDEILEVSLSDIYYVDLPEKSSTLTNILSVDVNNDSAEIQQVSYLFGTSQTVYVSRENIYVAYSSWYYDYEDIQELINSLLDPVLPTDIKNQLEQVEELYLEDYQKQSVTQWILQKYSQVIPEEKKQEIVKKVAEETERTIIHRIRISEGKISYIAQGNVPGHTDNQFSFSEQDGYLYISTTLTGSAVSSFIGRFNSSNNVFALDQNLTIVGSVNDIAIGERIYATRFVDNICYLVTFREIDPFYVIDLSNPSEPEILGWLKIPGYSTYLHPYDDTHIIGIGKEDSHVKLALFDVSYMQTPVEIDSYTVEDEDETNWYWSDSSALYEHKAFLFDRKKNLLVIPVGSYYEQSAYVFNISLDGFDLIGSVSHDYKDEQGTGDYEKEDYYWYDAGNSIQRSLYIKDVLYTISTNMIKMNTLDNLLDLNSIILK